jgi:hypothetical protein
MCRCKDQGNHLATAMLPHVMINKRASLLVINLLAEMGCAL